MYSVMYSVIHYKVTQFSRPENFEIEKLKLSASLQKGLKGSFLCSFTAWEIVIWNVG